MERLTPINSSERIEVIDIIRGFAILGIFVVNMEDFRAPWLYLEIGTLWDSTIDIGAQIFVDIFAQSSFYTLFSFLFGFGMMIFKERTIQRNRSFFFMNTKRIFWLLIIGIVHAFLVWHGDILISYAGVGIILYFFHMVKPRTLLIWSFSIITVSSYLIARLLNFIDINTQQNISRYNAELVAISINTYSNGSFIDITRQRVFDWLNVNGGDGFIYLAVAILPMFLLGAYVAKKKLFNNIEENLQFIKNVWLSSLIIGFAFKLMPYIIGHGLAIDYLQDSIGGPATALFYATSIILLNRREFWHRKLNFFAAVGRLSLSNYLFQSFAGTMIFYSYGLGLYGKVSPIQGLFLVAVIFFIQVLLSNWWVNRYRIGPMEWLWRSLTYGSIQKFKNT